MTMVLAWISNSVKSVAILSDSLLPPWRLHRDPQDQFTLGELIRFGSVDESGVAILEAIVKVGKNLLISGGTGSGKTTLLNCLCSFMPANHVVVTVEDAREIAIRIKALRNGRQSMRAVPHEREAFLDRGTAASLQFRSDLGQAF